MADEEISPEEESPEELINEPIILDASAPELVKSDTGNDTVGNMSENETEFVEASEDYEVQITESVPVNEPIPTTEQLQEKSEENIDVEPEKAASGGVQPEKAVSSGAQPVEPSKVSQKSRLSAKFHRKEQPRHTERQFLEMIGKHEVRNEELGRKEGALRHRLDVLECSMPAVMVWNIWRMAQGAPVTGLRRIVERQFRHVTEGPVCPRTPSRHYDCRVREIEAERKLAQKRVEEARTLCAEKTANLEEKQKKLDEAKKTQEERKRRLEELTNELKKLKDNLNQMDASSGDCVAGECGDIQCCERWMKKVTSNTSIKSIDLDYLERIQELAEAELCMKKQIADLEYREDTYMRTLQDADDCWSKLDSDSSESQLERKDEICHQLAARVCDLEDQLERLRSKFVKSVTELEKFISIEKIEALVGGDDDMASTYDKATCIQAKLSGKIVGRESDLAWTSEAGSLAAILQSDRSIGPQADLIGVSDREIGVKPGDIEYEAEKQSELNKYFSMLGSLDELDKDDDYVCPPEFVCNDVVTSPTGMEAEELARVQKELEEKTSKKIIDKGKYLSGIDPQLMQEFIESGDAVYDDEYVCDADFICNDVVTSPTGMDDEEAAAAAAKIEIGVEEEATEITKYESVVHAEEEIAETAEREISEGIFELEKISEARIEEDIGAVIEEEKISEMEKAVTTFEEGVISEAIIDRGVGPELEEAESLIKEASEMEGEEPYEEVDHEELLKALEGEEVVITEEKEKSELEAGIELAEDIVEEEKIPEAITEEVTVVEGEVSEVPSEHVAAEVPEELKVEVPAVGGITVPQEELMSWLNTIRPIHETISKCETCVVKADSAKDVATRIASYAGVEVEFALPPIPEKELEELPAEVEVVERKPEEGVEIEEAKEVARPEIEEEPAAAPIEEKLPSEPAEDEVKAISVVEEEGLVAEIIEEEVEAVAEIKKGEEEIVAEIEEGEVEVVTEMEVEEVEVVAEIKEGEEEVAAEIEEGEVVAEIEEGEEKLEAELEEGEIPVEIEGEIVVEEEKELEAELEEGEIPVEIEAEIVAEEEEELEAELEEGEIPVEIEAEIVAEEGEEEMPLELLEEEEALEEILEEELPTIEEREITEEDLLPEVPLPEAEEEEEEIPAEEIPSEEMEEIMVEGEEEALEIVKEIPLEGEVPVEIIEEEVPEEVEPIIEKPEIEILDIEPIEEKPKPYVPIKKVVDPSLLIDPQIVSKPYLSVAEVEQRDKASVKPMIQKYLAFVNRLCAMQPTVSEEIKIIKSEITKTETVQTELVQSKVCQKLTQTLIATDSQTFAEIKIPKCKVQDTPISNIYETSRGTSSTSPKKVQCQFQRKSERDQFGISTADKSSQTDRSHSKDRDPKYFASVGESAKLGKSSKGDFERELRSINYKKSDEPQGDCVCCACGKPNQGQKRLVAPLPALIHPIPMQPMKKPTVPFLKDSESCKLCPDCRRRKQKLSDEPKARRRSPKSPLACDSTACICVPSVSKTKVLSVLLKNFDKPQTKDQGCMAKIPKLKTSSHETRRKSPEKKKSTSCCCPGRKDMGKSRDPR